MDLIATTEVNGRRELEEANWIIEHMPHPEEDISGHPEWKKRYIAYCKKLGIETGLRPRD